MSPELDKPITYLKGIGPKKSESYKKLGIETVYDLLYHFPRRYIDFNSPVPIAEAPRDEPCVIRATLVKKLSAAVLRSGMSIFKAVMTDGQSDITLIMFNNKFGFDMLKVGQEYSLYGKVTGDLVRKEISSPLMLDMSTGESVEPVYLLTEGINQFALRQAERNALGLLGDFIYEPLPKWVMKEYQLCSLTYALENIHFPKDMNTCAIAKKRLVFDELLTLSLGMRLLKSRSREQSGCVMKQCDITEFYSSLPFELTGAQKRAIGEVTADMCKQSPMNRLVQGDVGSGKTAVAAGAAYFAFLNSFQTAMMAPTEILATQHYETLSGFLEPLGVKCALLTGSIPAKKKAALKEQIADGEYSVVVGTHALVQNSTQFKKLGLVITDEQHRFGVKQRAALSDKGENPHRLVMSATPIPRTLALMIYGDLDLSILDEMPKGRQKTETYAVTGKLRERAFGFVKGELDKGRQAYIVCPMIEESDSDLISVKKYSQELAEGAFSGYEVGLLHGKLPPDKKEKVMRDFKDKKTDILVSTTVIEVGVDVPNATVMVIENADRFGLSQLHQLRGRVGRGEYSSFCILITDNVSEESRSRLKIMSKTSDGFVISEEDLKMRGPGDFFGSRQHGLPKLRIADMSEDIEILRKAQLCAEEILRRDEKLTTPENKGLRELIDRLFEDDMSQN
ncbi:ATP-dependent DNA helicase RecG [Ruminococcus sp. NK3A76]|uniref:ATP-dependent DNA helicase RecG n=1 Tax=Ruminococcus sp. NK3A76 TaxID=877411 RepID=UPI0004915CD2|nr:ATP-dependent DNA helicase RecG [Ruminococcus sp. NK3A76]